MKDHKPTYGKATAAELLSGWERFASAMVEENQSLRAQLKEAREAITPFALQPCSSCRFVNGFACCPKCLTWRPGCGPSTSHDQRQRTRTRDGIELEHDTDGRWTAEWDGGIAFGRTRKEALSHARRDARPPPKRGKKPPSPAGGKPSHRRRDVGST